jgi:hypothetical protein
VRFGAPSFCKALFRADANLPVQRQTGQLAAAASPDPVAKRFLPNGETRIFVSRTTRIDLIAAHIACDTFEANG